MMSSFKVLLSMFTITSLFLSTTVFAFNNNPNESLEKTGDILQIALPITAAGVAFFKDDYEGLGQTIEGAIWTSVATHTLKFSADAERPNGGKHSFPSGHTSSAVQGAAFLQFRYGWQYGIPAYTAAAVVGYSRVDSNHHYWRDVAAGAALATGIQYAITGMGYSVTNFTVIPYINDKSSGLYARVTF